jgi:hypothetical protein
MTFSMYQISVPVYARTLTALAGILDKAAAHAEAKKIKPEALITARLFPDMWSLAEQVRAACNHATRGPARLTGLAIPEFQGKDATFADLKARVAWALAFVKGLEPGQFEASAERSITFALGDESRTMSGAEYLLHFSLPNFHFHATTAYDILRHNGVALEKGDIIAL